MAADQTSTLDLFRLDGALALVTGASRGLGRAIALGLAARGADLALVARRLQPLEIAAAGRSKQRRGKIINICSLLSERARPTIPAYTASKTGLLGLTRALAVEWAPRGINVNAIGPGYFATEMTAPLVADPRFKSWVEQRTPLGRWGQPGDLVGAAAFLATPASDFVTGQIFYVDGGWTAAL